MQSFIGAQGDILLRKRATDTMFNVQWSTFLSAFRLKKKNQYRDRNHQQSVYDDQTEK
jgi:hypothetical protein